MSDFTPDSGSAEIALTPVLDAPLERSVIDHRQGSVPAGGVSTVGRDR
jgi:hypothetical protein